MTQFTSSLSYHIDLPSNFRLAPFLAFYQRDPHQIAERVDIINNCVTKGMMWHHQPARLHFDFRIPRQVDVILEAKQPFPANTQDDFIAKVDQMLGLNQPVKLFEATHATHHELGTLIQKNTGLRVPVTATPFEALTWAVIGQQISVKAAVSLRRKWIEAVGQRYDQTLGCYPDAMSALRLNSEQLRQIGFSSTKARTLLTISQLIKEGQLPLTQWARSLPIDIMTTALMRIPGVGPWTVNYTLLRGFGWLDGSLHGDAGLQRALQLLQGSSEKITAIDAQQWLMPFSPWRALATAHLWHYDTSLASQ